MTTFDRPLSEDERALVNHISMWGSTGYPVRKVAKRWTWGFRSLEAPLVHKTKREATTAFETFMEVLYDCLRADSSCARGTRLSPALPHALSTQTTHGERTMNATTTLYTRTNDGLQSVTVPQSLSDEVSWLHRKIAEMREAMQNARQHLWGGNATEALGELSVVLNNDRTRS